MGSFGKTALSGQISGFSPQEKMGSFGNFMFWAFNFISLYTVITGLNQPNSNGTGLTAIK